jgi:putative ABC transport system permease protein
LRKFFEYKEGHGMKLHDIALKNIFRRKGKSLLVVAGLALGTASLVAVLTLMLAFQKGIDTKLASLGYGIVVHPSSSNLSLDFGGINVAGVDTYETISLNDRDLAKIRRSSPGSIRAVSPKLLYTAKIDGITALIAGTHLAQEVRIKTWWGLKNANDFSNAPAKLIAGNDVAKKLALRKGKLLKIGSGAFKVAAILPQTGSQDDDVIFADIEAVRRVRNNGSQKSASLASPASPVSSDGYARSQKRDRDISVIEVALRQDADTSKVIDSIRKAVPNASVTSIKQAVQFKEKAIGPLVSFGLAVTIAIVFISGLIVFLVMSSSVSDRKREIGIFRAIGYRRSAIARIILMEAFLQSFAAGIAGYMIGFALSYLLQGIVRAMDIVISVNILIMFLSLSMAVTVGMIAGMPAALKAVRISPSEAIRNA